MKDMKAALGNASKPDTTHVRGAIKTYIARACEYGSAKYERANYMRPTEGGTTKDDFIRFGAYLRSADSHITKCLDRMEKHLATDPNLEDIEGMLKAAFAADPDETPGAKVGASGLPHVAHAAAGLMMAIVQATEYGLLPKDPGQPWTQQELPITLNVPPCAVFVAVEEITQGDLVQVVAEGITPAKNTCPHDRSLGLACYECGGYARREMREG